MFTLLEGTPLGEEIIPNVLGNSLKMLFTFTFHCSQKVSPLSDISVWGTGATYLTLNCLMDSSFRLWANLNECSSAGIYESEVTLHGLCGEHGKWEQWELNCLHFLQRYAWLQTHYKTLSFAGCIRLAALMQRCNLTSVLQVEQSSLLLWPHAARQTRSIRPQEVSENILLSLDIMLLLKNYEMRRFNWAYIMQTACIPWHFCCY